jgi:p-hydroxybenzoate 3-monooxygenase
LRREGIADPILAFDSENRRCEFRTPTGSTVLDYAALTGGRPHYVYPQHRLVTRLYQAVVDAGADIRCGCTVDMAGPDSAGVLLSGAANNGDRFEVRCDVVVGCEGADSVVAEAIPGLSVRRRRLPVRWLAAIGAAPRLADHTIYAIHPRGFAGHMRRDAGHARYYLQVAAGDSVADWPERRVRDELARRLLVEDQFDTVPLVDFSFVDLRMQVAQPMQDDRRYLAGDAAHLITPAGGKGMNLAIQDAVELAHGLIDRFGAAHSGARLSAYSVTRLPAIWRAQAFSEWFLRIIQAGPPDDDGPGAAGHAGFADGIRDAWVAALHDDPLLARWFAHAYTGVDPEPHSPIRAAEPDVSATRLRP